MHRWVHGWHHGQSSLLDQQRQWGWPRVGLDCILSSCKQPGMDSSHFHSCTARIPHVASAAVCKGGAQEYCNRIWDGSSTMSPKTGIAGDSSCIQPSKRAVVARTLCGLNPCSQRKTDSTQEPGGENSLPLSTLDCRQANRS